MDRNEPSTTRRFTNIMSLSARRAWIEIFGGVCARPLVAWSLSARRAWIEILVAITPSNFSKSLSARRAWIEIMIRVNQIPYQRRRSPQGERG